MSELTTDAQLCDTVTPGTESPDFDNQELYDQTQSYGQTSTEEPVIYEENAIYEHPFTIEQAQIDESQEPGSISLVEKIEKSNDQTTEEPQHHNLQGKGIGLDELPNFSFYSEEDDEWFTRGLNRRISEVNF